MVWKTGCHSPALRLRPTAGIRHDMAVDHARHASRWRACRASSSIDDLDVRRIHRDAEMQHLRPRSAFAFRHRAGHQQVAGRRGGGEYLARGDAKAAFDLLGLARAGDPVGPAARQQDDPLRRHALQQRLDRRLLMQPAPGRDRHLVRVHGKGERGRAAMMRQLAQHGGQFVDTRLRRRPVPSARRPRPVRLPSGPRNCSATNVRSRPCPPRRSAKSCPSSRAIDDEIVRARHGFNSAISHRYAPSRWLHRPVCRRPIIAPAGYPIQFRNCIGPRSIAARPASRWKCRR